MTHGRWILLGLSLLGVGVAYFDRGMLAYAIAPIEAELGLTDVQFGIILSAFGLGYLFSTFTGGVICDRFGIRWTLGITTVCLSIIAALSSLADTFNTMLISRLGLGLGEGFLFLSMARMAGNWFPEKTRMTSMSAMIMAVPISCFVIGLALPGAIDAIGWRLCYIILGCVSLVWAYHG